MDPDCYIVEGEQILEIGEVAARKDRVKKDTPFDSHCGRNSSVRRIQYQLGTRPWKSSLYTNSTSQPRTKHHNPQ
jgi:hypothetical protein